MIRSCALPGGARWLIRQRSATVAHGSGNGTACDPCGRSTAEWLMGCRRKDQGWLVVLLRPFPCLVRGGASQFGGPENLNRALRVQSRMDRRWLGSADRDVTGRGPGHEANCALFRRGWSAAVQLIEQLAGPGLEVQPSGHPRADAHVDAAP